MAIELTQEQATEALKAGGKLYEMAIHQRDTYRALVKAIVAEYGEDFVLTLPMSSEGYLIDFPDKVISVQTEGNKIVVRLSEVDLGV